ncbi:hypothetical protein [Pedobacter cryoconitis]|uniref:Uncharacterized protein n=1 Tax=Pedobacter cryoconitis TaxID=188932 RepID=A0A327SIT4_9SPHI|nr:hypothetical protein [Pedobacter cryoconitis]RAJ28899.1 hypothetical protein LY11_03173 [Pedobacter cryoconitis]
MKYQLHVKFTAEISIEQVHVICQNYHCKCVEHTLKTNRYKIISDDCIGLLQIGILRHISILDFVIKSAEELLKKNKKINFRPSENGKANLRPARRIPLN